ncbi:MAG: TenA family protein [Euzebya sp.]
MDSRTLWRDSESTAQACLSHPFLTGIADGTLDRRAFEHYIGQDAFFLDAFSRAYALGLAHSADQQTMRRFKLLLDGAMDEQALHAGYARSWGVDLHPSPTAATRAYTDFLLRVAALEPVGNMCAAMTPCMRLYAWLGQQLSSQLSAESAYREWVQTYGSAEFEALAVVMEDLLNQFGGDQTVISQHYSTAMELELAFFDSAYLSGEAR